MKDSNRFKEFCKRLWTKGFAFWWLVSLATVLLFDILWMSQTTFRAFSYLPFWSVLFLSATVLTVPTLFNRNGVANLILLLLAELLFISNLMYCRTYYTAIPFHSYFLAGNLSDFTASVADSFKWYYLSLPFLSIISLLIYWRMVDFKRLKKPSWIPYLSLLALLVFLTWIFDLPFGGSFKRMDRMHENAYESGSIATIYSIPGYLFYDYTRSSKKITDEEKREVEEWFAKHEEITLKCQDSYTLPMKRRKNLVIILCESLESWPVGKTVEGKELTPFLNKVISDSTTFYAPNVVTQVGHGRSIDGQLLILAGMYPMRDDVYAYNSDENTFFTLPKAIKEKGGRTYLVTCDKPYVWNQSRVANAFGIDSLLYASDFLNNEPVGGHKRLSDGGLMLQSVEKLKNGEIWPVGERAFLMWVTYSGHNPFRLPENLKKIRFEGDYPDVIVNYMTTVNYTDYALSILIDYLKTRPDWEDTLVVITGDHEGLASDRKTALENPLSAEFVDAAQHTPLIILNSPLPGRFDKQLGEVDIYSSLLDLIDIDDYKWKGMGFSIFSPASPGVAAGSSGNMMGNTENVSDSLLNHIRQGSVVSDLVLHYDLLKNLL